MSNDMRERNTPERSTVGPTRVSIDDLDVDYTEACYQGVPFTGVAYEQHPDGSLVAETEYRNGLELGWARDYHPDGQMASEHYRGVFGPEGVAREWYPNGRLSREAFYEDGVPLSKRGWDEQGNLAYDWRLTPDDPDWTRLQARRGGKEIPAG